jgi:hypothetical protein
MPRIQVESGVLLSFAGGRGARQADALFERLSDKVEAGLA